MNRLLLNVCFAFLTIFLYFAITLPVFAATGIVNVSNTLSVRSIPGTGYSAITLGTLYNGEVITILNTVVTSDGSTSCSSQRWYEINYKAKIGYVCTSYIDVANKYDRPWTTPKKAIVGGALFKAENYISKGQFTSYLVKFNVNPGSTNAVYTHQYMTNVRAPYYEAGTSYGIYLANELLELPLVFTIPIFNNMPTSTALPNKTADTSGQTTITDTVFEAKLDAQGFPETYKQKLRSLHAAYPNWVFESLKTGLTWSTAINAEQVKSYIDSSDTSLRETYAAAKADGVSCKNTSGSYCLKEATTWYLANTATTAYFMDPRNFLKADRILMFEKLAYSSVYTAAIVQSRLNSTFMAGSSVLDNQTYASIFVDAGSIANISPVYLVSLCIQEVGVNGSTATTGEQFTYNNITYKGLFNFFNIGAYSSASSPVRAGLVWANGGATSTIVSGGTVVSPIETGYINQLGLAKTSGYITGVDLNQTVSTLTSKSIDGVTVTVTNANGTVLSSSTKLSTGTKIVISDGTNTYTNTVVIYGDINGDSTINAIDLLKMRQYLLNVTKLSGANLQAAKIAKKSSIGAVDLLYLRRYLSDSNAYKITQ